MSKNKIVFLMYICFASWLASSARHLPRTLSEAEDVDTQSDKWEVQWNAQPLWQKDTKSFNSHDPYMNIITGNSKEWTNFEHSQPLKRSDNVLSGPVPNPPLADDLGGLNMSNPISKYHCPINLLYGNNLTVKNFFLLMPRCNMSANDTIQTFQDSEKQEASGENLISIPLPPIKSIQNDTGSFINPISESSTMPYSLAESATTSNISDFVNASSSSIDSLASGISDSPKVAILGESRNALAGSGQNVTEEVLASYDTGNTTSEVTGPPVGGMTSANSSSESNANQFTIAAQESSVSSSLTSGLGNSTMLTTVDIHNDVLRTMDRYCETFNMSDNGAYTINPVNIGQQSQLNAIQEDKSRVNQQMAGLAIKDKRALTKKNSSNNKKHKTLIKQF